MRPVAGNLARRRTVETLGVYEAAIRYQIEFARESVWILDRICTDADEVTGPAPGHGVSIS